MNDIIWFPSFSSSVFSAPLTKEAMIDAWHLTDWVLWQKGQIRCCVCYLSVPVCFVCVIDEKGGLKPERSYCRTIWWILCAPPLMFPLLVPHHMFALHVSSRKERWKRRPRGTSTPWGSFLEKALAMTWRHLKTWGSLCTSISPAVAEKPT